MNRPNPTRPALRLAAPLVALALLTGAVCIIAMGPTTPEQAPAAHAPTDEATPVDDAPVVDAIDARRAPRSLPVSARQRDLALRAGETTLADAIEGLTRHAGGRAPDHNRWLFRVSGYLLLHPEACDAFAAAALTADATPAMQALAADVLAGVGHPAAQEALRAVVDGSEAGEEVRHRLVQSALMLDAPTPETAAWLTRLSDDPTVGPAAVNALGAVAGAMRYTHPEEARAALTRVRAGLSAATDTRGTRAHLLALANAGSWSEALDHIDAEAPGVRAAVARALRHGDAPDARSALHALVVDPNPRVQSAAIGALVEQFGPADVKPLVAALQSGRLSPDAQGAVLRAASRPENSEATTAELLDALAAHGTVARLKERARASRLAMR